MAGNASEEHRGTQLEASGEARSVDEARSFDEEPETHEDDDGSPPFPQEGSEDD